MSAHTPLPRDSATDSLRPIARAIAALWACFWTFFVWASVLSEPLTARGALAAAILSAVFLGSAAVAWRWERGGGLLLTVEGLLALLSYPQAASDLPAATITAVLLTLALPPLVAGTLCLGCRKR
jgi:hypothetical protein